MRSRDRRPTRLGCVLTVLAALGGIATLVGQRDEIARAAGHQGSVLAIAAAPRRAGSRVSDTTLLATAGADGLIRLWQATAARGASSLTEVRTLAGHQGPVRGVSFAPDGLLLASAGSDGTLRLWDVATGTERSSLKGHIGEATAVSFTSDAKLFASAGADGAIGLWRSSDGGRVQTLSGHKGPVLALAVSSDGKLLASGGADGQVILWQLPGGTRVRTLTAHEGAVRGVAFDKGGQLLASGGADGTVKLWLSATGEPIRALRAHESGVETVTFSRLVASGGADGRIRFWTSHNGLELRALGGPGDPAATAVTFFDDQRGLAFGDRVGTVGVWTVGLRRGASDSLLRAEDAVFVLDLASGQLQRIARGRGPIWSSDSGALAFDSESPESFDHAYAVWNGSAVRWFGQSSSGPIAMAAGRGLLVTELRGRFQGAGNVVAASEDAPARIVVHDLASAEAKPLPLIAAPRGREQWATYTAPLAVSPEDQMIALVLEAGRGAMFTNGAVLRSEAVAVRRDGTILRRLGKGRPLRYLESGELVLVDLSSLPLVLEAVDVATGTRRPLFSVPSWTFDLSTDGRRLVYRAGEGIYVVDAGGSPRRLIDGDAPALSPDGGRVAFGRHPRAAGSFSWEPAVYVIGVRDGVVRRYDVEGTRRGAPSTGGFAGRGWWSWASDGRRLAMTLEEPPDQP